jgi:hypothetical protein
LPEGVIAGGWSYVTAAYAVTVAGLAVYAWTLRRRWDRSEDVPD